MWDSVFLSVLYGQFFPFCASVLLRRRARLKRYAGRLHSNTRARVVYQQASTYPASS